MKIVIYSLILLSTANAAIIIESFEIEGSSAVTGLARLNSDIYALNEDGIVYKINANSGSVSLQCTLTGGFIESNTRYHGISIDDGNIVAAMWTPSAPSQEFFIQYHTVYGGYLGYVPAIEGTWGVSEAASNFEYMCSSTGPSDWTVRRSNMSLYISVNKPFSIGYDTAYMSTPSWSGVAIACAGEYSVRVYDGTVKPIPTPLPEFFVEASLLPDARGITTAEADSHVWISSSNSIHLVDLSQVAVARSTWAGIKASF